MAGKLINCDGGQSATDVGGKPIWKCHRKDESSLEVKRSSLVYNNMSKSVIFEEIWLVKAKFKTLNLHKTFEQSLTTIEYNQQSLITYQVKCPRWNIKNCLQLSKLILSSVTWKQNVHCSPNHLKFAFDGQTDFAGYGNEVFKGQNLTIWWKTSFFTKEFNFVYSRNEGKIGSTKPKQSFEFI